MIHFILCGHGSYGSSLKNSLEMLLPEVTEISVIDFRKDMSQSDLTVEIDAVLDKLGDQPTLIFCDMLGGAPFKTFCMQTLNRENKVVLAGVNLTAILEVSFQRENNLFDVAQHAVETTKNSVDYFPKN